MKIIGIPGIVCFDILLGGSINWTEEKRSIEADQVAHWGEVLNDAQQKPTSHRPPLLWLGLRNMGYRKNYDGHCPDVDTIYKKL